MVLILDGNSEIVAHVWRDFVYLICLRHMFKSRAGTSRIFPLKRPVFLHVVATCYELPSNKYHGMSKNPILYSNYGNHSNLFLFLLPIRLSF